MVIEEQISSVSRPPKAHGDQQAPAGCTTCSLHRPGWFCSLGGAALAELERASSAISLPPQASLFKQGAEARSLYILCAGYVKLMAGQKQNREMIVRVASGETSKPEALGHREYFIMYKHQNTPSLAEGCRA